MSLEQLQQLANLPLQVLLIIAVVWLWRAYTAAQNARIDDLKVMQKETLLDIRTRIVLLEARMGLKEEHDYQQTVPGANMT